PHGLVFPGFVLPGLLESGRPPLGGRGRAGGDRRGILLRGHQTEAHGENRGPAMRLRSAFVNLLALIVAPYAAAVAQRERVILSFDRAWRFHLGDVAGAHAPTFEDP